MIRRFRDPSIASYIRAGILIGISAFFSSCDRLALPWSDLEPPPQIRSTVPGRDEVAVAGDFHLSMIGYETLRQVFPTLKPDDLARLGLASLWLQSLPSGQARPTLEDAARCLRVFFPPAADEKAQAKVAENVRKFWGFSSLESLRKAMNDAWLGKKVEWNPDLLREYGISGSSSIINSG